VAENQRQLWFSEFAVNNVKIGSTNRARADADEQLTGFRPRLREIAKNEWRFRFLQNHGAHVDLINCCCGRNRTILKLQIPERDRASAISFQTPTPGGEGPHVTRKPEPKSRIIYSDSLAAEPQTSCEINDEDSPVGKHFLLVLGIIFLCALIAAGIIYWIESRHFPIVVAISPPDKPLHPDPLGNRGALVPINPDMLHVTSIALGNPRLTIVNGKRLAEEDWLVVKTSSGEASVRVISIQDGFVRFKHGGETIDARLQMVDEKPSPH
jgi:hypothetical protein